MVVGYLRVSTGRQHPVNQKDEIERFAAQKNIIVDRFVIEVASGNKCEKDRKLVFARPAFISEQVEAGMSSLLLPVYPLLALSYQFSHFRLVRTHADCDQLPKSSSLLFCNDDTCRT